MSIIIATLLREEGVTGIHTHVRQLRSYLARQNENAVLVTPLSRTRWLAVPIFAVNVILKRFSGSLAVLWYLFWHEAFLRTALSRRLSDCLDSVIYAQNPFAARAALRARSGPNQRVIMAVHFTSSCADEFATEHIKLNGWVFCAIRRMERRVIPNVDGLVYVSNASRRALLKWLPEAGSVPSAVISNFVTPASLARIRGPYADLVSIGALRALKNQRFLLEVLVEAKRTGRRVTLDVFGQGPDLRELMQLTHSLGLEREVRWRGFVPDVRDYLSGYRVYAHSSYSEALPLAIIEAMAAGLPVVAGEVGGISEMGESGLEIRFWPLDNPVKAAAILLDLLDHDSARIEASAAAIARFNQDFDASIVGARLLSFLRTDTRA